MSEKEEIYHAILFENNTKVIDLTLPKLLNKNGLILINCYIEKAFFDIQNEANGYITSIFSELPTCSFSLLPLVYRTEFGILFTPHIS